MPGHAKRYHYDEGATTRSVDSTLSSASGTGSAFSGSESTWSLPRSRQGNSRRGAEGPRRSGSSFRVSMRPKGHRYHVTNQRGDSSEVSTIAGQYSRRILCLLAGLTLIGTTYRALEPSSESLNYFYNSYDKTLSTEDLVAQGEMSATSNEYAILMSLPTAQPGSEDDAQGNFYEALNKNQQALIDELSQEATLSLRGNSLVIVDDEDKLPPKNDLNMTLPLEPVDVGEAASSNVTGPTRTDWGPALKQRVDADNQTTVAYILPIFTCYPLSGQLNQHGVNEPGSDRELMDAALMLQASVHKNSARNPRSGSSYDYEMVALVHRGVESCAGGSNRTAMLERIGYRVEIVREPIHAGNIMSGYLQKHAPRNNGGRAGMREMIRLYAFKMVDYRITVLVEPTTFILHPPDAIFDTLLNGPRGHDWAESHPTHIVRDTFYPNGSIVTAERLPTELDIMFTRDYSSMSQNSWTTGISLAFVPIRPSVATFKKLVNRYQSTEYDAKYGWDSKGYAHYAGSMQSKGIITYFFSEIQPHRKLELHRCIYNNLADVPFIAGKNGGMNNCRDVKEHKLQPDGSVMPCTDCRLQLVDEIVVINFAICRSPWFCPYIPDTGRVPLLVPTLKMCRMFHESWFDLRVIVEESALVESKRVKATGTFHPEIFHGYCQPGGTSGGAYVPMDFTIQLPEGFGGHPFPARK
jgi:hypothetical protein